MCGILAYFAIRFKKIDYKESIMKFKSIEEIQKYADMIKHRGPDTQGNIEIESGIYMMHNRLSIIDPTSGHQPFIANNIYLTINGEIFNYKDIKMTNPYSLYPYKTASDCEVILAIYEKYNTVATITLNVTEKNFDIALYKDNSVLRPIWRTFCSSLSGYGRCIRALSLTAGTHNMDFIVLDDAGNSAEQALSITL